MIAFVIRIGCSFLFFVVLLVPASEPVLSGIAPDARLVVTADVAPVYVEPDDTARSNKRRAMKEMVMTQPPRMIPCVGCGARVPASAGPTHPYIGASPGCWAIFGAVSATAYTDYRMAAVQRLTVDTYAVQHPGVPERRAIQSVAVHLISLYMTLERGIAPAQAMQVLQRAADRSHTFTWLTPPASVGALTVVDVQRAGTDAAAYTHVVTAWARATWAAWAPHHGQIRQWAAPERVR